MSQSTPNVTVAATRIYNGKNGPVLGYGKITIAGAGQIDIQVRKNQKNDGSVSVVLPPNTSLDKPVWFALKQECARIFGH